MSWPSLNTSSYSGLRPNALVYANSSVASMEIEHEQMTTLI